MKLSKNLRVPETRVSTEVAPSGKFMSLIIAVSDFKFGFYRIRPRKACVKWISQV